MVCISRLFVVVLVLVCTASAAGRDRVELRYGLKQGDTCRYDVTNRTTINSVSLPKPMSSSATSVFELVATNTTDEQIGLDFVYKNVQRLMQGAVDTTMLQRADTALKIAVILDRKGKILLAWPSSSLVAAYQSGARISGNGIQNSIRNIVLSYPPGAVKTGDTWSSVLTDTTYKAEGLLITRSTNTMKFDGVVDTLGVRCARILVHSDSLSLSGDSKPMGNDMTVSGNGRSSGVYYVMLDSGLLLVQTTKTEVDMFMTPAGQTEPAVSMHISTDVLVENRRTAK
jgi:hypothetical protein